MEELFLVHPALEHKQQYEAMMDEWEGEGGRLNPGALRRYSYLQERTVSYEEWLGWMEEDRKSSQDLYFLMNQDFILGAISIRYRCDSVDGHSGFGIRPSARCRGYASKMLAMALPVFRSYGIDPVVVSCEKSNIASAKTIKRNGGRFVREIIEAGSNEIIQLYQIHLDREKSDDDPECRG